MLVLYMVLKFVTAWGRIIISSFWNEKTRFTVCDYMVLKSSVHPRVYMEVLFKILVHPTTTRFVRILKWIQYTFDLSSHWQHNNFFLNRILEVIRVLIFPFLKFFSTQFSRIWVPFQKNLFSEKFSRSCFAYGTKGWTQFPVIRKQLCICDRLHTTPLIKFNARTKIRFQRGPLHRLTHEFNFENNAFHSMYTRVTIMELCPTYCTWENFWNSDTLINSYTKLNMQTLCSVFAILNKA